MNIIVNKSILKEVYSNDLLSEIEEYFNLLIDEEFKKDEIDTDFIEECVDAIDAVRNNNITPALKIVLTEKNIIKYCKNQTSNKRNITKKVVAACLIMSICSLAVMINTNTAFANQMESLFNRIISALNFAADKSEITGENQISSIYATFPKDYSFSVKTKDDINLENITITAVYKDGSEILVPMSVCTVEITEGLNDDDSKVLVAIAYNGCAFSIIYTVEE